MAVSKTIPSIIIYVQVLLYLCEFENFSKIPGYLRMDSQGVEVLFISQHPVWVFWAWGLYLNQLVSLSSNSEPNEKRSKKHCKQDT